MRATIVTANVSLTLKSIDAVDQAFAAMVKAIPCPRCDLPFTDPALEWGWAWFEGRRDLMAELQISERDGPFKVRCELCGARSWIDVFSGAATPAD